MKVRLFTFVVAFASFFGGGGGGGIAEGGERGDGGRDGGSEDGKSCVDADAGGRGSEGGRSYCAVGA